MCVCCNTVKSIKFKWWQFKRLQYYPACEYEVNGISISKRALFFTKIATIKHWQIAFAEMLYSIWA